MLSDGAPWQPSFQEDLVPSQWHSENNGHPHAHRERKSYHLHTILTQATYWHVLSFDLHTAFEMNHAGIILSSDEETETQRSEGIWIRSHKGKDEASIEPMFPGTKLASFTPSPTRWPRLLCQGSEKPPLPSCHPKTLPSWPSGGFPPPICLGTSWLAHSLARWLLKSPGALFC